MESDKTDDDSDVEINEEIKKNLQKQKTFLIDEKRRKLLKTPDYPKINTNIKNIKQLRRNIRKDKSSGVDPNILFSLVCAIICLILSGIAVYIYNDSLYAENNKQIINKDDALQDVIVTLKSMMTKYKNQERNLWESVFASIKMIIKNPTKPSIIVLLGNKWHPLDCLVKLFANVSSNALNTGSLLLTPENFDSNTGSVITSMLSKVQNNKAVIIWDLLNINVEAFKAFHNLCDTINPLIKEVIYLITIIADNYDNSDPLEFIEKEIWKKLNGKVKDDTISPLITRITDGPVLKIKSEPTIIDCPLPTVTRKEYKSGFLN